MGIIDKDYFDYYIKNNFGHYVAKGDLQDLADKLGIKYSKNMTKGELLSLVKAKELPTVDLYQHLRHCTFGLNSKQIQELLGVDHATVKKMEEKKFLEVEYTRQVTFYGKLANVPAYSLIQLLDMTKEQVEQFISANTKKLTEAQLRAIEQRRTENNKRKTCVKCKKVQLSRSSLDIEGLCPCCQQQEAHRYALDKIKELLDSKDKYIILDTETTGLDSDDKVIEISIIDMEGNVLLNTLVNTDKEISKEASSVHGITQEELKDKPTIKELEPRLDEIVKDKTILAFNVKFDRRLLRQSGYDRDCYKNIKWKCLMELYMNYVDSERYVSLARAMDYEGVVNVQDHRALGDCCCCLELIKAIVKNN